MRMLCFRRAGLARGCGAGLFRLCLVLLLFLLCGCAGRLERATELFYSDRPAQALGVLQKGGGLGQRNRLLYLMEQGVVLHQLGRYQQSIDVLRQAAELIEENEYISLSEQTASLVTTEWLTRYKGEYSERLWVHSYLMMDYLLLDQYDDALVEAKQALELFSRYGKALNRDYFTRALIALCFDNLGEDNDAFLEYRKLAELLPSPAPVAADLVRLAGRLGLPDEVSRYRAYLPPVAAADAELVLFVANGRIPRKQPGNVVLPPSIRFSFPYYLEHSTPLPRLQLEPPFPVLTTLSTDLAVVVRRSLEERRLQIIVKESARVAAKEAIAQSVGNKHGEAAEALLRVSLFLLEEPDTRSWRTLPGRLTLVRIPLSAGRHRLTLQLRGGYGGEQKIELPEFVLRNGQRKFYSLRF